jgi:hypothetical protein
VSLPRTPACSLEGTGADPEPLSTTTVWLTHTNHPTNAWNATNFGRHLGDYVKTSGGAIAKESDRTKRVHYKMERRGMDRFLRANGLLIGRGYEWAL